MKFKDINSGEIFDRIVNDKIGLCFNNSVYIHCIINDMDNNSISVVNCDTRQIERYTMDELNQLNIGFYQV